MKKPFSRIIALLISASCAGFATSALAEVTTSVHSYSPESPHYGRYARRHDVIDSVEHLTDGTTFTIHARSNGPSKLDPIELNHMYQCDTPICRGIR